MCENLKAKKSTYIAPLYFARRVNEWPEPVAPGLEGCPVLSKALHNHDIGVPNDPYPGIYKAADKNSAHQHHDDSDNEGDEFVARNLERVRRFRRHGAPDCFPCASATNFELNNNLNSIKSTHTHSLLLTESSFLVL